jgi:hypothetical protein
MSVNNYNIPDCISYDRMRESRLSGQELKEVYCFLVVKDGERCMFCGRIPPEVKLEVHHVDGNKNRHYYKNLGLSCHKCNCKHHPKGWKKKLNVSLSVCLADMPKANSAEIYLKKKYLPAFLNYLEEVFISNTSVRKEKIITEGAVESGFAHQKTIKGYLELLTCDIGPLEQLKDERTGISYIIPKRDMGLFKKFRRKYCS